MQPPDVEPLRNAPALRGTVSMTQQWRDLTFVHWQVPVEHVAPLLPVGTVPDVDDGIPGGRTTWVGLVPFRMVDAGLGRGPRVPWFGTFAETNVRLYSVDGDGRRGVVFRSLEASRLAVVLAARVALNLPYLWSRLRVERTGDLVTYTARRRWPGPPGVGGSVRVDLGDDVPLDDPTARFLTARWGLHTRVAGRLMFVPNEHPPWPLRRARLLHLDDGLVAAAGLPGTTSRIPESVLFSDGVATRFGLPFPVTPRHRPSRAAT